MSTLEFFTNKFQKTLTIKNELIPTDKTRENIEKSSVIANDEHRAEQFEKAKKIMDKLHRDFINTSLENFDKSIDWNELYDVTCLKMSKKNINDKSQKVINDRFKKEIKDKLKAVSSIFSKEKKDLLLKGKGLKEILKTNELLPDNEKNVLKEFEKFTTYFENYFKVRENLYTDKEIHSSIAYRLVVENFSKFAKNIVVYEEIKEKCPQIFEKLSSSLLSGKTLSQIFDVNNYNNMLSQNGIDFFNQIIGGSREESCKVKVHGLNELINLTKQDNKSLKLPRFYNLYKLPLSLQDNRFKIDVFTNHEEVIETVGRFFTKALSIIDNTYKLYSLLENSSNTINSQLDLSKIYVQGKNITALSFLLYKEWDAISLSINSKNENDKKFQSALKKNENDVAKVIEKEIYSLNDLAEIMTYSKNEEFKNCNLVSRYVNAVKDQICVVKDFIEKTDLPVDLKTEDNKKIIKDKLDSVMDLFHKIKLLEVKDVGIQLESTFYSDFDSIIDELSVFVKLYNKVRNFATKKPYSVDKIKLNFENLQLAGGWAKSKINECKSMLLLRDNKYYLAIINKNFSLNIDKYLCDSPKDNCYKVVIYNQLDASKQIFKCSLALKDVEKHFEKSNEDCVLSNDRFVKELKITKHIYDNYVAEKHIGETADKKFVNEIIDFSKEFLKAYCSTCNLPLDKLKSSSEYNTFKEFTDDVTHLAYSIQYKYICDEVIRELEEQGNLYLFQIYNKDFSLHSKGKKNLHTMYFENIFSEENLKDVVIKLNGGAELFFRKASLPNHVTHKKGVGKLINKVDSNGRPISDAIYKEVYDHFNHNKSIEEISIKAKELIEKGGIVSKTPKNDIVKDRRYTIDKFFLHTPIIINFKCPDVFSKFNKEVLDFLRNNPDVKIIGVDRGERHLIYVSLIDQNGRILLQKSFNIIEAKGAQHCASHDYHEKLHLKEQERKEGRRSWNLISSISNIKEGYLSQVIHEIATLMVEHNAIVVLEDLNAGFKRVRSGVAEKSVYQKFEKMLIEKLNYFVQKGKDNLRDVGSVLNGYQLTSKFESFEKIGKQCGFLFYVRADYTSVIDPTTGFSNVLTLKSITNTENRREIFKSLDSIKFCPKLGLFCFSIDLKKDGIKSKVKFKKNKWDIYSYGKRSYYDNKTKTIKEKEPTKEIIKLFNEYSIDYSSGEDLRDKICSVKETKFFERLFFIFNLILKVRNDLKNDKDGTMNDVIISPIMNSKGYFYDSSNRISSEELPDNGDANGAYHIALKGLMILQRNNELEDSSMKLNQIIKNEEWFNFIQNRNK